MLVTQQYGVKSAIINHGVVFPRITAFPNFLFYVPPSILFLTLNLLEGRGGSGEPNVISVRGGVI